jgi:hypothetical protein
MSVDAKRMNLLYVSDAQSNDVYVFSYPKGALEGTLKGFDTPQGLCVDKAGNVFVTEYSPPEIVEYSHGGSSPIATLSDSAGIPADCSVDPTTGNLAVTNLESLSSGSGSVLIFADARGTPSIYSDPNLHYYYYCSYDGNGNLYVDGTGTSDFAELPSGGSEFTNITLNQSFYSIGGVLSHGKYVAIGDSENNFIYKFKIRGTSGTRVHTIGLGGIGSGGPSQFWIQGENLIGPIRYASSVDFWNYKAGGSPTRTITGLYEPVGSTVSLR